MTQTFAKKAILAHLAKQSNGVPEKIVCVDFEDMTQLMNSENARW
jgi:hypothetical protein